MNLLYKICLVLIISVIFFFSEMRVGGDGTSLIVEVNASKVQFGAVIWRLVIWKMMNWVTFFFQICQVLGFSTVSSNVQLCG